MWKREYVSAIIKSTLDVADDAFDEIEMGSAHKEAGLMNCISNLRACEGEVLESANETAVESEIIKKITVGSR
jgi:hypothetical protein